jgi:steroid delta-isomerase-like uncharacterized protein
MAGTTRDTMEALLLRWLAAIRQRDPVALADMVSPECVVESMTGAGLAGKNGIRHLYGEWFNAFPDVAVHTQETLIDGDRGMLAITLAGTDSGGFMGLPPTGRSFRLSAVIVLTVADGQVVRYRSVYDFTGLLVQVGILKAKPV